MEGVFLALFLVASAVHLYFCLAENQPARKATKCLLMPLLLVWYVSTPAPILLVSLGLGCGFVGDVLLLSDKKSRFIGGAAAFLAGHVLYAVSFVRALAFWPPLWQLLSAGGALLVVGVLAYGTLRRHLGEMKLPVLCYLLAICAMAFFAALRALSAGDLAALLCLIGALCFLLSDYLLAVGNFKKPFFKMDFWIMLTYLCAQLLIILSFVRGLPTF